MEKIKIAELEINNDKLLGTITSTKKAIDTLVDSQKELKKSGDTSSETFVQNEAKLKVLRAEYNSQIKVLNAVTGVNEKLNKALSEEVKGVDAATKNNKELKAIRNQLNSETEEGAKAIEEINKKMDANTKLIQKNSNEDEKRIQNIGKYPTLFKAAGNGVKAFGLALKAAGIGLVVGLMAKLTDAMGRNQKVMDVVNTVGNAFNIIFDKIVGTLVDTVSKVSEITGGFDSLGKVIKSLMTLAITPLKAAFYGIYDGILSAQIAWEDSFLGGKDQKRLDELNVKLAANRETLKEIGDSAKQSAKEFRDNIGEAFAEVSTLGSEVGKSISNISFKGVISDAKSLTDIRKNVEALVIQQERLIQTYEIEAERLRQVRDDESLSIKERQEANKELGVILNNQFQAEKEIIALRISAAQTELSLNQGNIDLKNEILRLQNEELALENRIEGARSEKLANDNSLRNEEIARIEEFQNKKKELEDEYNLSKEESDRAKEELKIEQEYEAHLAELERMQLFEEEKTELEALLLQNKEQALLEIRDSYREEELEKTEALEEAKRQSRRATLDAIIGLLGEETAIGKAALIAKQVLAAKEQAINLGLFTSKATAKVSEATVDIAAGTAKSASAAPFPANIPLIIGFIASVAGIIGAIKSATKKGKSDISSTKFAQGGILRGSSHAYGGIKTAFGELEGGEAVINKNSTAMYAPLLSAINEVGGGRKFAQGGILGSTSNAPSTGGLDVDAFLSGVANLPNPIVSVEEINTVASRVGVLENTSTL